MAKRIERTTSRTAAMTCMSRAASFLESNCHYHSNDHIALKLLPGFIRGLFHLSLLRKRLIRFLAPLGVYAYVIARTRYIDAVFEKALGDGFHQILLLGAGYDTRALRFQDQAKETRIFELDELHTQQAKIRQLRKRHLRIPENVVFIPIDFEKASLSQTLERVRFQKGRRNLFVLEGLLMYLDSASVQEIFRCIRAYGGPGSRLVFDYIRASVLRHENTLYGEAELVKTVHKAGEPWRFGIDPKDIHAFSRTQGFKIIDHKCARDLEASYFQDKDGRRVARINETHCIVTMERQ